MKEAELAVQLRAGPARGEVVVHVTVDRAPAATWKLRTEIAAGTDLALLVPTRDDFGNREFVTIHDAWWGKLPPLPAAHRPAGRR